MKHYIYIIVTILIFNSCSVKITSNKDKDIDISKSKTYSFYGWVEMNDLVYVDKKAIEKAFSNAFEKRGLTYTETGGDLIISFFLVVDKESTTNRYNAYYGHGPYGFYQPTWGWGTGFYNGYAGVPYPENSFYEGTLVVDVFDRHTKKLVWQGVITKAIDIKNHKKKDYNRQKLADRMMKTFPIMEVKK
jgi:hypothetical protein